MPTLNRFPLLGLWAKEAARRLGYGGEDAEALGHAYAVLYAIRAQGPPRPAKDREEKGVPASAPAAAREKPEVDLLELSGDKLEVTRDGNGRLTGRVGGGTPQTPRSYRRSVRAKFPAGYYDKLEEAFRQVWAPLTPRGIEKRLVYKLYDQWKKSCASGRLVDLDKLLQWCRERVKATP